MQQPQAVNGPCVWRGTDYRDPADWVYTLSPAALADIDSAVRRVREAGLDLDEITPAEFDLPALADDLAAMAEILHSGRGFVRLQGIDRARYSDDELGITRNQLDRLDVELLGQQSCGILGRAAHVGIATDHGQAR